jgi:excisionase family DNA binding protein
MSKEDLITVKEAAKLIGESPQATRYHLQKNKLPRYYVVGKGYSYKRSDVEKLAQPVAA